MNKANPMPMGAINVARDFSAASMRMTKTSSEVRNISMKTPCAIVVPFVKRVMVNSGPLPGNKQELRAAPAIPPSSWAGKRNAPRIHGRVPVKHIPNVTCGMKFHQYL